MQSFPGNRDGMSGPQSPMSQQEWALEFEPSDTQNCRGRCVLASGSLEFGRQVSPLWELTRDGASSSPGVPLTVNQRARPLLRLKDSPLISAWVALGRIATALESGAQAGAQGWRHQLSFPWLETHR